MSENPTDSAADVPDVRRTVRLTKRQDRLLRDIRAKMEARLNRDVTVNEVFQLAVLCLADQEHVD